jgi:NADH:ubiquinone oxidoreductase subunit B-like Fe-S oxidoreductase
VDVYLPGFTPHNPAASSAAANNRKKIMNSALSTIDPLAPSLTPDKQAEGARA